jgi:hypothetical protein
MQRRSSGVLKKPSSIAGGRKQNLEVRCSVRQIMIRDDDLHELVEILSPFK